MIKTQVNPFHRLYTTKLALDAQPLYGKSEIKNRLVSFRAAEIAFQKQLNALIAWDFLIVKTDFCKMTVLFMFTRKGKCSMRRSPISFMLFLSLLFLHLTLEECQIWAETTESKPAEPLIEKKADPQAKLIIDTNALIPIEPISGSLVIVGGGKVPDVIWQRFMKLAGGKNAHIVVIPTASKKADTLDPDEYLKTWRDLNPASVKILHTRSKEDANDPNFIKPLEKATAIWFGGGGQSKIADVYLGTLAEKKIHEVLKRGGVIGGTSAGAAIMSRTMIARGLPKPEIATGLGFIPGVIIDQHFIKRHRQVRLVDAVTSYPHLVGLGIDEGTALVVYDGSKIDVLGDSCVTVMFGPHGNYPIKIEKIYPQKQTNNKPNYITDLIELTRRAQERSQPPAISSSHPLSPLEKCGYVKLTGHSEMMAYLKKIDSLSDKVQFEVIGNSVEGREIPTVMLGEDKVFGSNRGAKPIVFIFAAQHGDEPSGKEAALILIRELAIGLRQDVLKELDVLIVPLVNPDGAEKDTRRNANDMDLNRNHVVLSEPESLALHTLFLKWMPEVVVDVHESDCMSNDWLRFGYRKNAEEMLDCVSNLNISPEIIKLSMDVIIPEVGQLVKADGFTFYRYTVGGPPEKRRIRHSTTNINDGRQSTGIYNTFSFILEGQQYSGSLNKIKRRTAGQISAISAFLNTIAKYREKVLSVARSARQKLLDQRYSGEDVVHIQMDYVSDPERKTTTTYPLYDINSQKKFEKELGNYEPLVKIKKSIKKPVAYIFSKNERRLAELLSRHQIEMSCLKNNTKLKVEEYKILSPTRIIEQEKRGENVEVKVQTKSITMEESSVVVFLQQRAGNLIPLLLEPQSRWGICTEKSGRKYHFGQYLKEGRQYPILRLMQPVKLKLEKCEKN